MLAERRWWPFPCTNNLAGDGRVPSFFLRQRRCFTMAASKLCRHTGQVRWAGDGARWRQTVVLAKGRWRAPAAQPRGADPLRQRRCFIMLAPKLCRHMGEHGRTMNGWRLVAVGGAAGSTAVAADACDNGDQQRGQQWRQPAPPCAAAPGMSGGCSPAAATLF